MPAVFVMLLVSDGLTLGGIAAFDPRLSGELGVQRAGGKLGDAALLQAATAVVEVRGA